MRAVWLFGLAALVGLMLALTTWVRAGAPVDRTQSGPNVPVYVLDNGFHSDFVAPRSALTTQPGPLKTAVDELAPGNWVLVGWGDAKFYVDQRPISARIPDGARAFFAPGNASVLMLRPETQAPEIAFLPEGRRRIIVSARAFDGMRVRIERSLDMSSGAPRIVATRPGDPVRFLASDEPFSVLHLCNHWAAEVLNAGGLAIRPFWAITSGEVGKTADRAPPA